VGGVKYAKNNKKVWAAIGLHPHEASKYINDSAGLQALSDLAAKPKVVAVGEIGLDYYYNHSGHEDQKQLLHFQLKLAQKHNLPVILHVRNAFDDFWPIFDEYSGLKGVVHSFTATTAELQQILARGLYVGLNGIVTFTQQAEQIEAIKAVPLDSMLLETDAPYLTPVPFRGKICQPKYVRVTGEFLANLRGESLDTMASVTTANARKLFSI